MDKNNKDSICLLISFFVLIFFDLLAIAYFFYKGQVNFALVYKHLLGIEN